MLVIKNYKDYGLESGYYDFRSGSFSLSNLGEFVAHLPTSLFIKCNIGSCFILTNNQDGFLEIISKQNDNIYEFKYQYYRLRDRLEKILRERIEKSYKKLFSTLEFNGRALVDYGTKDEPKLNKLLMGNPNITINYDGLHLDIIVVDRNLKQSLVFKTRVFYDKSINPINKKFTFKRTLLEEVQIAMVTDRLKGVTIWQERSWSSSVSGTFNFSGQHPIFSGVSRTGGIP